MRLVVKGAMESRPVVVLPPIVANGPGVGEARSLLLQELTLARPALLGACHCGVLPFSVDRLFWGGRSLLFRIGCQITVAGVLGSIGIFVPELSCRYQAPKNLSDVSRLSAQET